MRAAKSFVAALGTPPLPSPPLSPRQELADVAAGRTFGTTLDAEAALRAPLPPDTLVPGVAVYSRRANALAAWTNGLELAGLVAGGWVWVGVGVGVGGCRGGGQLSQHCSTRPAPCRPPPHTHTHTRCCIANGRHGARVPCAGERSQPKVEVRLVPPQPGGQRRGAGVGGGQGGGRVRGLCVGAEPGVACLLRNPGCGVALALDARPPPSAPPPRSLPHAFIHAGACT